MKVLFYGMGWFNEQKGGLNRYLFDMVNVIGPFLRDYRVVYCSNRAYAEKHQNFLCKSTFYKVLTSRRTTKSILNCFEPDIVNIHFALYAFSSMDLLNNYKKVMNFHGPWAFEGLIESSSLKGKLLYFFKRRIELYVYRRCDAFIVLSQEFKNILIQNYGIDQSIIEVIFPTLNVETFNNVLDQETLRKRFDIPINKTVLFTARRLVKRTGVDLLINSMSKIENTDVILLIAGRGHYEFFLKKIVVDLGLNDRVFFLGFVKDKDLPKYYSLSDITVMPTISLEGFGLTTIESFASGTPVVGTPSSANVEVIGRFNKSLLSKSISSDSLAEILTHYTSNLDLLPSEFECKEYVNSYYGNDTYVANIKSFFRRLV